MLGMTHACLSILSLVPLFGMKVGILHLMPIFGVLYSVYFNKLVKLDLSSD